MKKIAITTIPAAHILTPVIGSRDIAEQVRSLALKAPTRKVVLDFINVDFISRSAAHELMVIKEDLARRPLKKKELSFERANSEVERMFAVVAASHVLPKKKVLPQIERVDFKHFLNQELV